MRNLCGRSTLWNKGYFADDALEPLSGWMLMDDVDTFPEDALDKEEKDEEAEKERSEGKDEVNGSKIFLPSA